MKVGLFCSKASEQFWRSAGQPAGDAVKLRAHHTDAPGMGGTAQALQEALGDCKMLWVPSAEFDAALLPKKPALYAAQSSTAPPTPGSIPSFPLRQRPEVKHLQTVIQSGKLGQIGIARISICRSAAHFGPLAYSDLAPGANALQSLGVHGFDLLRWCFGEIERVNAMDSREGGAYALVVVRLASGAIAHLELSLAEAAGADYFSYEIAGANGILEYDSRKEPLLRIQPLAGDSIQIEPPREIAAELQLFVEGNAAQLGTAADALAAAAAVKQAIESAQAAVV